MAAVDLSAVTEFQVSFLEHDRPNAQIHLNNIYRDVLLQPDRLYAGGVQTDVALLGEAALLDEVRRQILEDIIVQRATETPNADVIIPPIFNNLAIQVSYGPVPPRRFNRANVRHMLIQANNAGHTMISFSIVISNLHFDSREAITYLDWTHMSSTGPFPTGPGPAAPPSAVDIATAVAGALPAAPSAADVG